MVQQSQKNWFPKIRGLYAILDLPHVSGLPLPLLAQTLVGQRPQSYGARVLQLRAKYATTEEKISMLKQLSPVCRASDVTLIVNDDIDAALAMGSLVDGVHLGQTDVEQCLQNFSLLSLREQALQRGCRHFLIGVSTHNFDQLAKASQQGADYVGFGPIFPTTSKHNPEAAVGLSNLKKACQFASCPVVAIGGLQLENVKQVIDAGASSVAMISALIAPRLEDIRTRIRVLARTIEEAELSHVTASPRHFQ